MLKKLFGLKNNTLRCNGYFQDEMSHKNIRIVGSDGEQLDEIPKYVKIEFKKFDKSTFVTYTIYYDLLDLQKAFDRLPSSYDVPNFEFDGSNIIVQKVNRKAKHSIIDKQAPELSDVELQMHATLNIQTDNNTVWDTQELFPLRFKSSPSYVRFSINLDELAEIFLQQAKTSNELLNRFHVANVVLDNHDLSIELRLNSPYMRQVVVASDTLEDCDSQLFEVPMDIQVMAEKTDDGDNVLKLAAQPLYGQLIKLLSKQNDWIVPKGYKIKSLSEPTFISDNDDCPSRIEYTFDESLFPEHDVKLLTQFAESQNLSLSQVQEYLLNNYQVPEHDDEYISQLSESLTMMYNVVNDVENEGENEINKL